MLMFFFFQAEDGIRDKLVTGVQTCALPISACAAPAPDGTRSHDAPSGRAAWDKSDCGSDSHWHPGARPRSEERRVGKECRSRWTSYQKKKKKANSNVHNSR